MREQEGAPRGRNLGAEIPTVSSSWGSGADCRAEHSSQKQQHLQRPRGRKETTELRATRLESREGGGRCEMRLGSSAGVRLPGPGRIKSPPNWDQGREPPPKD